MASASARIVRVWKGWSQTEVVVATVWDSLDAIKAFAGDDYERAVVEPVVRQLLHRFDVRVAHFSIALTV